MDRRHGLSVNETFEKTPYGNLAKMYGGLDYTDEVVLDIGADEGWTARFFLSRGADRVLVSEKNPELAERLEAFARTDQRIELLPPLSETNAETFLREHRPGIVKVDCEKCERFLLDVSDASMGAPKAWVMETHTRELYDAFYGLFTRLGYQVQTVEEFPNNPPERCVKVIQALRP
jgi:hypothetical protein